MASEVTIGVVSNQYDKTIALRTEYFELVAVREALIAIKGLFAKAEVSFDLSKKSMIQAYEMASNPQNVYSEGINRYLSMVNNNKKLTEGTIESINTYSGHMETAITKVETAIENKHDEYMEAYNTLYAYIAQYEGPPDDMNPYRINEQF